jgi:hypothetical protein
MNQNSCRDTGPLSNPAQPERGPPENSIFLLSFTFTNYSPLPPFFPPET